MDIKLFEKFLIDDIGLNKEIRTKILEYVQKPSQSVKIEENIEDKPIEGQRPGETLTEYALRYRKEYEARENNKILKNRKDLNESFKDLDGRVASAFNGMKNK